jgi:hypothetical protein
MKKQNTEIFQNGKLLLNYKTDSLIYLYLLDPSHITEIEMILEVTQEALDLNL